MIYIPFLYFSFLLLYILLTKKRFDISACITMAYIITSFFAIIIDIKQLYGSGGAAKAQLEIIPTLLYCLLITITILPFKKLPALTNERLISIKNLKLLNSIVYFYFAVFVIFMFFFGSEIYYRLNNNDIASLRLTFVQGEDDLGFSNYSGILRILARLTFIIGSSAMFLHVFYFYSIAFQKNSYRYNLIILLCSTLPIIISMLSMDRSKLIYWLMSFIAVATFFWPAIDKNHKKQIKYTFIILFALFSTYLALITNSRYGSQNIGATNSIIVYAGQSFNNFSLFYNKLNLPGLSLEKITPVLHLITSPSNTISRADMYQGAMDTNVFASFAGMMLREIGLIGTIIYCSLFYLITNLIFKKNLRYNITKIFLVVILLYIPYLGIFGLYYSSIDRELSVWAILILCYFLTKKFKS